MSQHTELIASLRAESDELIKYQFSHTKEAMSCLQRLHDLSLEAADALQALEPDDSGIVPDSDKVICPGCSHQFTAIPGNVQARLQALERVTWQPIETAPKDGTQVMLTNGISVAHGNWLHAEPFIREIRDLEGRYIDQDESDGYDGWIDFIGGMMPEPTLWMPLPTPPESKE